MGTSVYVAMLALATSLFSGCATADDDAGGDGTPAPAGTSEPARPGDGSGPGTAAPAGPSDADPDKDADPNAPSPPDDTKTPPATREQLIKAYAPRVHLHPDDVNRPANVDWYLARDIAPLRSPGCPDHEILELGKVTQASLVAQKHADNKSLCRHDGSDDPRARRARRSSSRCRARGDLQGRAARGLEDVRRVAPDAAAGIVDIEYWVLLPVQRRLSRFNHEADWEQSEGPHRSEAPTEVRRLVSGLQLAARTRAGRPEADDRGSTWAGTHPIAYAAKGTHANYPAARHLRDPRPSASQGQRSLRPLGRMWTTETALVAVGTRASQEDDQDFVKFWGRWGELGDLPETNGVTRHFP